MINNSTNTNKASNHISPSLTEHKKDYDILRWKSKSCLDIDIPMWRANKDLQFQQEKRFP